MTSIIIFGAGIAGLSAAHELIELGHQVKVYEALDQPGGFFRSSRQCHTKMPPQTTPVENLFLAGAHTRTQAHVWSIEGAVESGRRAAKAIDGRVPVVDQYLPSLLRYTRGVDDFLFAVKGPCPLYDTDNTGDGHELWGMVLS